MLPTSSNHQKEPRLNHALRISATRTVSRETSASPSSHTVDHLMANPLCVIVSSYTYHASSTTTHLRVEKDGLFLPYANFPGRPVSARILSVLYVSQDLNSSLFYS